MCQIWGHSFHKARKPPIWPVSPIQNWTRVTDWRSRVCLDPLITTRDQNRKYRCRKWMLCDPSLFIKALTATAEYVYVIIWVGNYISKINGGYFHSPRSSSQKINVLLREIIDAKINDQIIKPFLQTNFTFNRCLIVALLIWCKRTSRESD